MASPGRPSGGGAPAPVPWLDAGGQADARGEGDTLAGEGGAPSAWAPPAGYEVTVLPAVVGTTGA
eukprot:9607781-Alexandrium_andersonii.AAC.1